MPEEATKRRGFSTQTCEESVTYRDYWCAHYERCVLRGKAINFCEPKKCKALEVIERVRGE
ncbi:MAG: hypothetical protein M1548_08530 [Actinobacteria bacterium]|nr:hypothetical protein [Actinomycetota bacterium]